jgi:kynurenine formamidase
MSLLGTPDAKGREVSRPRTHLRCHNPPTVHPIDNPPPYSDLPVKDGAPTGSAWGLWGDDDQLGTLNLLTDERTRKAAALVEQGSVFPLNLPLETEPCLAWREPPRHRMLHIGAAGPFDVGLTPGDNESATNPFRYRDDVVDGLWLQGGSQWDGLKHVRHLHHGNYNGVPDADVHTGEGGKLGVDQWSARAIVGRGVLLDLPRFYEGEGRAYNVDSAHEFTVADVRGCLDSQGVKVEIGDILLLHSGWTKLLVDSDREGRTRLLDWETIATPGLEQSLEMVEYIWNLHPAAIGSDTLGVEAMKMGPDFEFFLHEHFLPLHGMPIGELWDLDALAADCARDGRYAFLLVSVPLNVRGGTGSPPQAVAIK